MSDEFLFGYYWGRRRGGSGKSYDLRAILDDDTSNLSVILAFPTEDEGNPPLLTEHAYSYETRTISKSITTVLNGARTTQTFSEKLIDKLLDSRSQTVLQAVYAADGSIKHYLDGTGGKIFVSNGYLSDTSPFSADKTEDGIAIAYAIAKNKKSEDSLKDRSSDYKKGLKDGGNQAKPDDTPWDKPLSDPVTIDTSDYSDPESVKDYGDESGNPIDMSEGAWMAYTSRGNPSGPVEGYIRIYYDDYYSQSFDASNQWTVTLKSRLYADAYDSSGNLLNHYWVGERCQMSKTEAGWSPWDPYRLIQHTNVRLTKNSIIVVQDLWNNGRWTRGQQTEYSISSYIINGKIGKSVSNQNPF